ncbi:MAG: AAA family ATPase [Planctomycetota bacterium]|nr:AAA family ATPase [Planctomycetota bacterium]
MSDWTIETIGISGGFLSDLTLRLPKGLICVIGPRGSGKSTLAEVIRLLLRGIPPDAPKPRLDLLKANLGNSVFSLTTSASADRGGFTIRRTYGQTAILTAADARPVTTVDLDRGTFLPIDAYSSLDIEAIADESLGSKRRTLLDDLCTTRLQDVNLALSEHRRLLEANADGIKAIERRLHEITEQMEEIGDVKAKLEALPPAGKKEGTPEFRTISKQRQLNEHEAAALTSVTQKLTMLNEELQRHVSRAKAEVPSSLTVPESANAAIIIPAEKALSSLWVSLDQAIATIGNSITAVTLKISQASHQLRDSHASQEAKYLSLQHLNQEAVKAFETRSAVEKQSVTVATLEKQRSEASLELRKRQEDRKSLKAAYILTRDKVSELREEVATRLHAEAGSKVRIRVQRNADILEYQQQLLDALHGTKLKNQEDIIKALSAIRPEDLALMLRENDFSEFETHTAFGKERGRKILDIMRQHLDPLRLEVLPIDDRVIIELNVSTGGADNFKDASELSRGQKCTALLPILLARRDSPLVIDQPEDNLDNHFIYETVVESILRLKSRRQMIFITHNANIPVLGEAELVVVMNSDGRRGFVEKAGTVDECRNEIIDLLEGGEEAFELRRKRYGST